MEITMKENRPSLQTRSKSTFWKIEKISILQTLAKKYLKTMTIENISPINAPIWQQMSKNNLNIYNIFTKNVHKMHQFDNKMSIQT